MVDFPIFIAWWIFPVRYVKCKRLPEGKPTNDYWKSWGMTERSHNIIIKKYLQNSAFEALSFLMSACFGVSGCFIHLPIVDPCYTNGGHSDGPSRLISTRQIWWFISRVNYHSSLTWIVRPFGDDFPKINHDSKVRENRVRSWWNLPRINVG